MSIDFATLQGLTIPEGVVTQIADASGRVLWALANDAPIVLEVEKITSDTYVSSTSYTDEEFLLLDIYPKKANSTVDVTYGGLTKTLTFSGTNAQQVYFGTFGGVADSVTTPASGTLTIEGGCKGVGPGSYNSAKSTTVYCYAIKNIVEWGGITIIPARAFYDNRNMVLNELPDGITSIGDNAFYQCQHITVSKLPSGIKEIPDSAFYGCYNIPSITLHEGIESIGPFAFRMDASSAALMNGEVTLPSTLTSLAYSAFVHGYNDDEGVWHYINLLSRVKVLATTPPTLVNTGETSAYVLPFGDPASIYFNSEFVVEVPAGCGEAYKTADGWSEYADYIVEAS